MIAGLEEITEGELRIGDRVVNHVIPAKRDVSMVFQSYALYPHMTVAKNIESPLITRPTWSTPAAGEEPVLRRLSGAERKERIDEAARMLGLESYLDRKPGELSGGQRQRVALARAIVRRPAVFLMDEPLSNLDAKLRGYMRAELKHMQHDLGVTTVYVTHDQVEAMTLAHRVAVMDHGVLQQIGTPREVYDQPANLFVAGFMGSPPMNLVHGRIEGDRFACNGIRLPLEGKTSARDTVLGFRPEDAEIVDPGNGLFDATVFAAELTGDVTLVTITLGDESLAVKMPKEYEVDFDSRVAVRFPLESGFLFDAASGERIDARLAHTSGP
jgi:multiple sugar transport system ATP-binding protein